uniref:DUF736 family protein n=1 Tax=Enterobacter cloacae complex sp. 280C5 TaxID=3395861 RepID=UPI003CF22D7D
MANIGTFTAEKDGFTGQLPHPDPQLQGQAGSQRQGRERKRRTSACKRPATTSAQREENQRGRADYLSVAMIAPFPATVYARLIEGENDTHDLIWSRSKPKAA